MCGRELGWKEGLGLWYGPVIGGPSLLTIASKAMAEDDVTGER